MKKLASVILSVFIGSAFVSSMAFADAAKGQKLYLKYLKKSMGMNGAGFAALHTQDEWEEMFENDGEGVKALMKEKGVSESFLNGDKFKKFMPHIKDFAIEYASDSGNVPSC
jgi:hypothetical protein